MVAEAVRIGRLGDYNGKADLLLQAGHSGDAWAFYELARMYQDGQLPKDEAAMVSYLIQAQSSGSAEAGRVLGHLYIRGHGVPEDAAYGRMLLEDAAKTDPRAAREYGVMLTNQRQPFLNDLELGIQYLQQAARQGDSAAAEPLAKALQQTGTAPHISVAAAEAEQNRTITQILEDRKISTETARTPSPAAPTLKDRAMQGDATAVFEYAQQVLISRIPSSDPTFTGYCWLAVADKLGHPLAKQELAFIEGVRQSSQRESPGRLDQCISDLHYQITGGY